MKREEYPRERKANARPQGRNEGYEAGEEAGGGRRVDPAGCEGGRGERVTSASGTSPENAPHRHPS